MFTTLSARLALFNISGRNWHLKRLLPITATTPFTRSKTDLVACCLVIDRQMGCGASTATPPPPPEAEPPKAASKSTGAVTGTGGAAAVLVASSAANFDGIDPRVVDAFKLMDKNGDGELSKTEILIALRKQEAVRSLLGLAAVKFSEGEEKDAFEAAFSKMDAE